MGTLWKEMMGTRRVDVRAWPKIELHMSRDGFIFRVIIISNNTNGSRNEAKSDHRWEVDDVRYYNLK